MNEKIYKPGELANKIGISIRTVQRWDENGQMVATRTATNRRFYTDSQPNEYFDISATPNPRKIICYTRVSSRNQKEELKNQVSMLEQWAVSNGTAVDEWVADIGSGLNYERKNFVSLMDADDKDEVSKIIAAHTDRLVRFGNEWLEMFCRKHDCEIVVINLQTLSPEQQEVTQD